nr:cytochrome P450 71A1-like [Ipomoea batatas]
MENSTLQLLCMILFTLAIATATFLFYYTLSPPRAATSPPSPPRLPIIGHLHLLTDMPHRAFAALAQDLGPVFHLHLGQVPTLVISSARHAELVLRRHDHAFASRPQLVAAQYLSFGCSDITFSSYGPYWRQARRICVTELLSSKRVDSFKIIRDEEVNRLVHTIVDCSDTEVDMSELFFALANDILCRVAFGKRFRRGESELDLVSVLTETQALLAGFCLGDFFPRWEWINTVSGMKRRLMNNLKDLKEVCDEIIDDHLRKNDEGREDFVDVLLKVQKRNDLEVPITDDNLKALVLDMFVAGTDTTSSTLEWTMTALARNPRVMTRAQDEVRKVIGGKGKVEESDLQHLPYMKAVIKESMRLYPPVPLLVPRESMEKCILDGYEIPAKTRVLINTYAIGRDPESWENPLEYYPERFLEQDIDFKGQDFKFLPFGGGRRGCPGYSLGLATIELSLARLLYHFNWRLPAGLGADDVDMTEIFGLATRKKSALKLVPSSM